jgi:hypothetical protein
MRIERDGCRHPYDGVLKYYFLRSDVEDCSESPLTVATCMSQARNAQAKFKDSLKQVGDTIEQYESEVATSRIEPRYQHLVADNTLHTL